MLNGQLDNSSDSLELLSGSMLADMLLSPHNRHMSGLLFGAWEAVYASDDPGTCRCVELDLDLFNQDEVEVIVPLIEVSATQSVILSEVTSCVSSSSSNNSLAKNSPATMH